MGLVTSGAMMLSVVTRVSSSNGFERYVAPRQVLACQITYVASLRSQLLDARRGLVEDGDGGAGFAKASWFPIFSGRAGHGPA